MISILSVFTELALTVAFFIMLTMVVSVKVSFFIRSYLLFVLAVVLFIWNIEHFQ